MVFLRPLRLAMQTTNETKDSSLRRFLVNSSLKKTAGVRFGVDPNDRTDAREALERTNKKVQSTREFHGVEFGGNTMHPDEIPDRETTWPLPTS
jgi:hypothetical protein